MMTRKKFVAFAILTTGLVLAGGVLLLLSMDLLLHARAERSAGLNRWGYRGPVVGRKQPGETRLVMLGGSTAFGYGVMANESIPAMLEQRLRQRHPEHPWTVVNLGYNTEGAYAFLPNLEDFAFLDYDLVMLYEGYNDLYGDQEPNLVTVRRQSPIFRSTGYFPILPLWLNERALVLRSGGANIAQAYDNAAGRNPQTVFRPNLTNRATASALDAVASVTSALERQFDRRGPVAANRAHVDPALGCPEPWITYCASQHRAIEYALARGTRVLVVGQPELTTEHPGARHAEQQRALGEMVQRVYGSNPRVAYLRLGAVVNLRDPDVSFDLMHLSVDGNRIVADALVDPVVRLWSAR